MKNVGITCIAVLASMVFFSLFWAPWVEIVTQSSADLAAVKVWIWLAGLIASGAATAYLTWPPDEAQETTSTACAAN
jgi:hypothetical protein